MAKIAWPYLRPFHTVNPEPWQLVSDDGIEPLPSELPYWDYNTDLRMTRVVEVDAEVSRAQCGLASDAELGLTAVWTCSGSGMRGVACRRPIVAGTESVLLETLLSGPELGGTLTMSTCLVLLSPGSTTDPAAPRRPGSILWTDQVTARLQGDAARFPMDVVDFDKEALPAHAAWHLRLGRDLEAAAMGSMLLLINGGNKTIAGAAERAAQPRPLDTLALSAMFADVARAMIEHGVALEDFADDGDYPEDSLGLVLRDLCSRLFPHTPIADLRRIWEISPNLLATEVQAAVRIFGGEAA